MIQKIPNTCNAAGCLNTVPDGEDKCFVCKRELATMLGTPKLVGPIGAPGIMNKEPEAGKPKGEFSGGDNNYWLLNIKDPKRLKPYEVECEDIIEALNMTFAEGNVFKALWRSCKLRELGEGKAGQDEHGIYDGDKIAYYAARVKVQRRRKAKG